MNHDFQLADFDIELRGDERILSDIKQTIRNSWNSDVREEIDYIRDCPEFQGTIVAVVMNTDSFIHTLDGGESSVPVAGSLTIPVAQRAWGLFHYDSSAAYYGPIVPNESSDGYHFEGRHDAVSSDNATRIMSNSDIKVDNGSTELMRDILDTWDTSAVDYISQIQSVNFVSMPEDCTVFHTIQTQEAYPENRERDRLMRPTVPTGRSIERLLMNGWGVCGICRGQINVSQLEPVLSDSLYYSYACDNSDEYNMATGAPLVCDVCEKREYVDSYRDESNSLVRTCWMCSDKCEE